MTHVYRFDWDQMFEDYDVPIHLRDGLRRYLEDGIRPGDFLCAVITCDLREAVTRCAPPVTAEHVFGLVQLLIEQAPAPAWGSRVNLKSWCLTTTHPPMPDDLDMYSRCEHVKEPS